MLEPPPAVTVYEVGPRDGLQNEAQPVDAGVKIELIERLAAAGLPAVEATSFVRPEWVPQLADAEQVAAALPRTGDTRYPVLVPNAGGLRRAIAAGAREIAVFGSATETFSRRNLNRGVDEALEMFAPVVADARAAGLRVRGYVSMAWGDPWEGDVPVEQVAGVARRMWALGLDELALGDTIGVATPIAVQRVLRAVAGDVPRAALAVHFHDTYGQALANVLAALDEGIAIVDASVAGLGGCPYAQSATGNLATEDLVYMLDGMGVTTRVDLDALVATARWIARLLGRRPGAVARAR
jgi:hydroxymethylglutaryl-CoA lyase